MEEKKLSLEDLKRMKEDYEGDLVFIGSAIETGELEHTENVLYTLLEEDISDTMMHLEMLIDHIQNGKAERD